MSVTIDEARALYTTTLESGDASTAADTLVVLADGFEEAGETVRARDMRLLARFLDARHPAPADGTLGDLVRGLASAAQLWKHAHANAALQAAIRTRAHPGRAWFERVFPPDAVQPLHEHHLRMHEPELDQVLARLATTAPDDIAPKWIQPTDAYLATGLQQKLFAKMAQPVPLVTLALDGGGFKAWSFVELDGRLGWLGKMRLDT